MSKILIIGDLHLKEKLSYSDYVEDKRIPEKQAVINTIIEASQDCDKVVLMGDQFNSRNNSSIVIREFVNFIERFNDKDVYIIAGNHEKLGDGTSAIDFLQEIKNKKWHIVNKNIFEHDGLVFCPYFTNPEIGVKNNSEGIQYIMDNLPVGDILFLHHSINGFVGNNNMRTDDFSEIILPRDELEKRYKKVIAGHVHTHQIKNNTILVGSIFTNEIGDNDKFIFKLDTTNLELQSIKIPNRRLVKIENPTEEILNNIEEYSIVKMVFSDIKLKDIITRLRDIARERFDAYTIVEQYPRERKKVHFDDGALELSLDRLLEIYSKEKKVDIDKLKKAFELIKI
jgi:UDP-2,3-diacylglucosamine pyrophosphatase LpxH